MAKFLFVRTGELRLDAINLDAVSRVEFSADTSDHHFVNIYGLDGKSITGVIEDAREFARIETTIREHEAIPLRGDYGLT